MREDDLSFDPALEAELTLLDRDMPHLQARYPNMFALANAWAERHDAILRRTPASLRQEVQARLLRIGIRWGVMPGRRVTINSRRWRRYPRPLARASRASATHPCVSAFTS
jgi:hypothetical protein